MKKKEEKQNRIAARGGGGWREGREGTGPGSWLQWYGENLSIDSTLNFTNKANNAWHAEPESELESWDSNWMWQAHREGGRQWLEGCRGREPSVKVNKKHTQTDEKLCRALKRDSGGGSVGEKGIRGARRGGGWGEAELLAACCQWQALWRTNKRRTDRGEAGETCNTHTSCCTGPQSATRTM